MLARSDFSPGDVLIYMSYAQHWEISNEVVFFVGTRKKVNVEGYYEEAILVQNAEKAQKWVLNRWVKKV